MMKTKLAKFGSEAEFRKYYISREARKLLKEGKSVSEVRDKLGGHDLPDVSIDILIRLKLVKLNKRKGKKESQQALERQKYLNSKEFRDKMQTIKTERENQTFADWVEENTGIGKEMGGTCIRPDIFLTWNNRSCDECPYYEYCLCYKKRLSGEKKKKRLKRV